MTKKLLTYLLFLFFSTRVSAQEAVATKYISIKDSIIRTYQKGEGYSFVKTINANANDSLYSLNCYSGKQVLVMAVFENRPIKDEGFLYVYQKTKKGTVRQSFAFEEKRILGQSDIYARSVKIFYPSEANAANCYAKVTMQDKEQPNNKYYFLLFIK